MSYKKLYKNKKILLVRLPLLLLLAWCSILLFLAGCSVRPLYEDATTSNGEQSAIKVDVIPNRDGQKLRSYLLDYLRDVQFTQEKMRLSTSLGLYEKSFALDSSGYSHRLLSTYTAHITLRNSDRKVIMNKTISVSTQYNIAQTQGEMMLSLYGRNNSGMLKELAHRIVENIRMTLETTTEEQK